MPILYKLAVFELARKRPSVDDLDSLFFMEI